tara:strand:+ start:57 stop:386 length:330 start_codon:yes stop_codon:yes gene_type:complete
MASFIVDYRSPPSGLGHIATPGSDDMILITYPGCGLENDPKYHHTIHLTHPDIEKTGWIGPVIPLLHQILKSHGVTEVYDTEEGYKQYGPVGRLHFHLQDWIKILKSHG